MRIEAALDTNVLLYALSKAPEDARKSEAARRLMREVSFGVPLQVLQEFYHASRRKARLRIGAKVGETLIAALLERPLGFMDVDTFRQARALAVASGIGYWDAAVVSVSATMGAPVLYTEDLNDGQVYAGVRVVNPFAGL